MISFTDHSWYSIVLPFTIVSSSFMYFILFHIIKRDVKIVYYELRVNISINTHCFVDIHTLGTGTEVS